MDIDAIFRSFLGLRNGPRLDLDPHQHYDNDEDNNEPSCGTDEFFPSMKDRGLDQIFQHFHGNMWREMENLHRQMEDMMKGFGTINFSSDFEAPPILTPRSGIKDRNGEPGNVFIWSNSPSPFFRNHGGEKNNPRDFMLKEPDAPNMVIPPKPAVPNPGSSDNSKNDNIISGPLKNTDIGDSDLDGKISHGKMVELIGKSVMDPQPHPQMPARRGPGFFSSGKSVSVSTIRGPDGRLEQKKIVRDSSGCEESTVTKSLGDKSYTVTTITTGDGKQETHQTLQNMDEKDLGSFKDLWNTPQQKTPGRPQDSMLAPQDSSITGREKDLFSKLFG